MSKIKMHADEIDIDISLVKKLLISQFPQWAGLSITPVESAGTDNAIFRLGTDLCARFPRIESAAKNIEKEHVWLPKLSQLLPLPISVPLEMGEPHKLYPWHWSICRWLKGEDAALEPLTGLKLAAVDLAQFIKSLQKISSAKGPTCRRSGLLATQDQEVRGAIESLHGVVDTKAIIAIWEECLQAPAWERPPVWTHGDLLPTNLLVNNGRLSAVIDFDLMGVGDPACDLIPAWSIFSKDTRNIFRSYLQIDDAMWVRGRGWALSIAVTIIPYYRTSNPKLVAVAERMIREILADY